MSQGKLGSGNNAAMASTIAKHSKIASVYDNYVVLSKFFIDFLDVEKTCKNDYHDFTDF